MPISPSMWPLRQTRNRWPSVTSWERSTTARWTCWTESPLNSPREPRTSSISRATTLSSCPDQVLGCTVANWYRKKSQFDCYTLEGTFDRIILWRMSSVCLSVCPVCPALAKSCVCSHNLKPIKLRDNIIGVLVGHDLVSELIPKLRFHCISLYWVSDFRAV